MSDSASATKERLHKLLDELPDDPDSLDAFAKLFSALVGSWKTDPVLRALLNAPPDDELETPEETRALHEARERVALAGTVSLDELKAELGL